jgi:lipopolysaccharide biosynthesis glycosyltransferase
VNDAGVVHVATGTNNSYLHWCATTILSAIRSTPEQRLVAHVIVDRDVGMADRGRLSRMALAAGGVVEFLELDEDRLSDLPGPVRNHGGAISCARFLLPDQLPSVDRLVYLDADTLTAGSLAPLAAAPLDGSGLGAVTNVVEPRMRWHLERLGLADRPYLNSGVLVMDLDWMRRHDSPRLLLDCLRDNSEQLLWVDQDALNLVFGDGWARLHPRWNAQNSLWRWPELAAQVYGEDASREALQAPSVLHFEGPSIAKPWHYLCTHPYAAAYRDVAGRTPWGPVRLSDRTPATALIARMPPSWRLPAYVWLLQARSRFRRTLSD